MGKLVRKAQLTNGGPIYVDVDVEANKIVRVYPVDLTDEDPESWEIEAHGRTFKPPRRTTINSFISAMKSMVHSDRRILYPLRRIGFDVNGERNQEERGEPRPGGDPKYPGYERISWDEALDIVSNEIIRLKREYGPGAMVAEESSHHLWGNIGYRFSALLRFINTVGMARAEHNPDSWEGFHWGSMHMWGMSNRLGIVEQYDLLEDCLQNCEMLVFWASDPEATNGSYGGYESNCRRRWMKELGMKMVFIDPYYNHTAGLLVGDKWLAPQVGTDAALAAAIIWQWLEDDTYDHWFVENRVTGVEEFTAYIRGETDGVPKTPEWAAEETLLNARDIRKLAREWASHKTMLACGGNGGQGGPCRGAVGLEYSRMIVALVAFQGLGKPGVNLYSTTHGAPNDMEFYFPGYGEGAISGDADNTATLFRLAYKMFDGVDCKASRTTINTAAGVHIPRLRIPEIVLEDKVEWFGKGFCGASLEAQFKKYEYPAPGFARMQMYYRYGGSMMGTMGATNRYAKMYRSRKLPMVVNQSIWFEGEAQFADIILPACTNFERWDIGEWANSGGYAAGLESIPNHRVITLQQKCIEPLGESKSDYEIFRAICGRLGYEEVYSQGMDELDWVKKVFYATDLPKITTWEDMLEKGHVIVPYKKDRKRTPAMRWFYEGRETDTAEKGKLLPLDQIASKGLQTQSGKIELVCNSLKRFYETSGIVDEYRPVMTQYLHSWEGHHTERFKKYPIAIISPHPKHSFHTMGDAKDGFMVDVKDSRVWVDGWPYWVIRINTKDAEARGIKDGGLVKAFNDRGEVILCAQVTERLPSGTAHSYMACAEYAPLGKPGESADRGGCINLLSPMEYLSDTACGMATSQALIEIEKWEGGK